MSHIFLSYSRSDSDAMRRLRQEFSTAGLELWVDETGLTAGTPDWEQAVEQALRAAQCVVVILSPEAKQSRWVGLELAVAERLGKRIFPLLVSGTEDDAVPMRLEMHQRMDAREDYATATESLIYALKQHMRVTLKAPQDPAPSLALEVTITPEKPIAGDLARWSVEVRNDGNLDLNPVTVGREGGRRLFADPFPLKVDQKRRYFFSTQIPDGGQTEQIAATGYAPGGEAVQRKVSQTVGLHTSTDIPSPYQPDAPQKEPPPVVEPAQLRSTLFREAAEDEANRRARIAADSKRTDAETMAAIRAQFAEQEQARRRELAESRVTQKKQERKVMRFILVTMIVVLLLVGAVAVATVYGTR